MQISVYFIKAWAPDSTVSIVTTPQANVIRFLAGVRNFSLFKSFKNDFGVHPASYSMDIRIIFIGLTL